MPLRLDTSVQYLKGVGPRRAEIFARMGIRTVEDLLYHIPHRYLDATNVTPIARADVGREVTLIGRVVSKGVLPTRRRLRIFRAVMRDASGLIECAWPGQAFLDRTIKEGQLLLVSGPVKYYHGRQIVPREQIVLAGPDDGDEDTIMGLVLPVYPASEGLSHRQIRRLIHDHLDEMLLLVQDVAQVIVPPALRVPPLRDALEAVHRPDTAAAAEAGRRRLAFDELFDLQLVVARARHLAKHAAKGMQHEIKRALTTQLKNTLPFELTAGQRQCIREITADMTSPERMHRLLMGDVGSGKTIVALFAMLLAVENDSQAVFMAPTELLAEQHAATLSELLVPLGIVPELLLGRFSASEKKTVRGRISAGGSRVIVGTHALFQEQTRFHRLGLVVIDEQHRFGVEQRAALIEKGETPDVLLLSATPIPRTLALTLYGDLDISALKEKPAGRREVKTTVRSSKSRKSIYQFVRKHCDEGRQVYVVYPVIEESEKVDLKAATTMWEQLKIDLDPLVVGLVHGKLKTAEREATMRAFRDGEIQVLVATTVIEVGIDVPNATIMIIEHPERFGLAQMHQLRGRVGRGADESHCILVADQGARTRLAQFAKTTDGFRIAQLDLEERGMGQLAGARQSGGITLRYTDFAKDDRLIVAARKAALGIIENDPALQQKEHRDLRKRIERRYERGMELFRVG
ncbi:MAG: ATP-dependent DNA helicase RecG [Gemmatimonadetes bacterium]|nr:ATP-dependent DNA helicase RecG [Gemmatimonadota bacterium]